MPRLLDDTAIGDGVSPGRPLRRPMIRYAMIRAFALACLLLVAALGLFAWLEFAPIDLQPGNPLSLFARRSVGVTIVEKQAASVQRQDSADALVAEGATAAAGFAMDLGPATSFAELSSRFAAIASANQEMEFERLEARATLRDTIGGFEARLLVGPFASVAAAKQGCASIALPATVVCRPAVFAGELISRE